MCGRKWEQSLYQESSWHNTVNQLYFNFYKLREKKKKGFPTWDGSEDISCGGFKVCLQIPWQSSLQEAEPSSPPLECGLHLITRFQLIKWSSSAGFWPWRPGHKRHHGFLPVTSLALISPSRGSQLPRHEGWHTGEGPRRPANSHVRVPYWKRILQSQFGLQMAADRANTSIPTSQKTLIQNHLVKLLLNSRPVEMVR